MAHIHDKIDFTVEAFIVYKNKVLLRKHDKYNIWLGVGGHIELSEDPNEAVCREVKEEVGLDFKISGDVVQFKDAPEEKELVPPKFINRHRINEKHEHIAMIFFGTSDSDKVVQGENERSENVRWFTKEELRDSKFDIRDKIRYYATEALEGLNP